MQPEASRKSFRLEELAALTGAQLYGDPAYRIEDVAELEKAGSRDISFCANSKYLPLLLQTNAGALFVHPSVTRDPLKNYLVTDDPSLAFQKALKLFREDLSTITGFTGIHPTAVIHPSAQIGKNVRIAPHVVIDAEAIVGDECWINAGCYIGYKVSIGKECHFHAHVTIREGCVIGDRVILQPGVVIGSCGFGYHTDAKGKHTKLEQTGIVIIEDDVEIGANTTIDRARFDATRIGRGSKIDNLVQIGHNATLGEDNLIVAQTAIAGSAKTGRNVVIAGQSALTGHISVADFTILTARSAFSKSVTKPGGKFGGVPAIPLNEHMRQLAHLRQLGKLIKRIEALEQLRDHSSE